MSLPCQLFDLNSDLRPDRFHQSFGESDKTYNAAVSVLSLGQQIRRNPTRLCRIIRDNQNFAWPRHQIDRDKAENLALGLGYIGVSGPKNLVDGSNHFCAEGHCGDSLCAAYLVNFGCSGQAQGCKEAAVNGFCWTNRRSDYDLRHTCNFGQGNGHYRSGHQRSRTGGHIDTDSTKRIKTLAYNCPLCIVSFPVCTLTC